MRRHSTSTSCDASPGSGDQVLHLARVLGRAMHVHAASLLGDGIGDLAFQVELLLPAHIELPAQRCGASASATAGSPRVRCIGGST
jgi:hypothetical protein